MVLSCMRFGCVVVCAIFMSAVVVVMAVCMCCCVIVKASCVLGLMMGFGLGWVYVCRYFCMGSVCGDCARPMWVMMCCIPFLSWS